MWRITMTQVLINASRNVVFPASGGGKADALRKVLEGHFQHERLPAQAIKPIKGRLTWLVDKDAAEGIKHSPRA